MAGESILIVDDSPEIVDFLVALLKPLGYVLSWTGDGREGLTKAIYEKPDLVLLDLNLPGISGIAILEALHQRGLDTPVIVMTFHGSESVVTRALRLGARGYLVKPFEVDDILAAIERVLREERERRVQDLYDDDLDMLQPEFVMDVGAFTSLVSNLTAAPSQHDMLAQLTEAVLHITGAAVGGVFLREGSGSGLILAAVRYQGTFRSDARLSDGHAESVMRSGQPSYILGSAEPPTFAVQLGIPVHSLLYVPVALRERVLGVLSVGYVEQNQELTGEIQSWLIVLGNYAALLLDNMRVRQVLHKSIPVQRVRDVLNLFVHHAAKPLRALWRADEALSAQSENAAVLALARQVKIIATLLSVLKESASSNSPIYFGTAQVAAIEKEIEARLARIEGLTDDER